LARKRGQQPGRKGRVQPDFIRGGDAEEVDGASGWGVLVIGVPIPWRWNRTTFAREKKKKGTWRKREQVYISNQKILLISGRKKRKENTGGKKKKKEISR